MNGSVQRTIPNVMLPFRSMIPKSRSAAYYGSEYQLGHYVPTDIFRRELSAPAGVRHQRKPDWDGPHGLHPRNDRCRIPAASILDHAFKNPLPKWDRVFHMVLTIGSEAEWAGAYPLSLPERKQNINCRIMRQLIFPVAKKAKRLGGKRHVLIQATLSTKLNGRTEWTVADAAVLFKEPVEDLVSDFAIEAISGGSEYQLAHYAPVDISRQKTAAPAGSRVSVPRHPSVRRRAK